MHFIINIILKIKKYDGSISLFIWDTGNRRIEFEHNNNNYMKINYKNHDIYTITKYIHFMKMFKFLFRI